VENRSRGKAETQSGTKDGALAYNNNNSNSGSNGPASLDLGEEEKEVNDQMGSMDEKPEKEERANLLTYSFTYSF
jgi:hypothetical protein